jgi:hypothetical protein
LKKTKSPSIITTQILPASRRAVGIIKRLVFIMETAGCGFCIAKGSSFFRPGDNSPSTGHFTRKALLCVFAIGTGFLCLILVWKLLFVKRKFFPAFISEE